ncbi:amidohydrolase family protein [Sphingomonas nostoxanthinifaciens]|uniref:amidohydrolase family protein n=1 Tax=Sphingomonas nostoxanthinifaciens TaxID=2872652 RepID=UPI001CC1C7B4|nr:amidohydrolase family protein [Sphingomonas nostoxanthinifaciens]UAK23054.1 amidohydrolase family protein [Sphingomonas nostoxanthinifaciens]
MIDAHVHLWRLGQNDCTWPTPADGIIHRDFALEELLSTLDAAGMPRAMLVQTQESARDTDWLLALAAGCPRIAGVVGWADLRDPAAVRALAARPGLCGLRPMVQHCAPGWYDDPALDAGFAAMAEAGLVLDALIRVPHLPALDRLAARHPTLRIAIDHAAKPSGLAEWRAAIAPLAERSNVVVKLSGLWTEISRDDAAEVITSLLTLFGPARLMWASDWPVVTPVGSYRDWLDFVRDHVPARDHAAVFGGNAAAFYRLEEMAHA